MSDQTGREGTVTSLWTDVALDDAAVGAQRRALLVELAAERFDTDLRVGARSTSIELAAARHLARAARLARESAELERSRCAMASNGYAAVPSLSKANRL